MRDLNVMTNTEREWGILALAPFVEPALSFGGGESADRQDPLLRSR